MKVNQGEENGEAKKPEQIPLPAKFIIGTEIEISMQWGNNEPIIFGYAKISGDPQKDVFGFTFSNDRPGNYKIEHPNDPSQRFIIGFHKKGTLDEMIKQIKEGVKASGGKTEFQSKVKNLAKPKPKK